MALEVLVVPVDLEVLVVLVVLLEMEIMEILDCLEVEVVEVEVALQFYNLPLVLGKRVALDQEQEILVLVEEEILQMLLLVLLDPVDLVGQVLQEAQEVQTQVVLVNLVVLANQVELVRMEALVKQEQPVPLVQLVLPHQL